MTHHRGRSGLPGRGFTLIELLVVISIISLLIAILMPALAAAREVAGRAKCLSGARQGQIAIESYCSDYRESYPSGGRPGVSDTTPYHVVLVNGGYVSRDLFTRRGACPHGPELFTNSFGPGGDLWTLPTQSVTTYGFNPVLQGGFGMDHPYTAYLRWGTMTRNDLRIKRHSQNTPTLIDCQVPFNWWTNTQGQVTAMDWAVRGTAMGQVSAPRHKGEGVNSAFADGHGEFLPRDLVLGYAYSDWLHTWMPGTRMYGWWWVNAYFGADLDGWHSAYRRP